MISLPSAQRFQLYLAGGIGKYRATVVSSQKGKISLSDFDPEGMGEIYWPVSFALVSLTVPVPVATIEVQFLN